MIRMYFCSFAALLLAAPLKAEIFECNGKWTNKPCEGTVTKSLKEQALDPRAVDPTYRAKRSFLRSVYQFHLEMQNEGMEVPVDFIDRYCMNESVQLKECYLVFETVKEEARKKVDELKRQQREAELLKEVQDAKAAAWAAEQAARNRNLECNFDGFGRIKCRPDF